MSDVKLEDAERTAQQLDRIIRHCDDWLGTERAIEIAHAAVLLRQIPRLHRQLLSADKTGAEQAIQIIHLRQQLKRLVEEISELNADLVALGGRDRR